MKNIPSDKEIEKIEKKAEREVNELFDSWMKDVEYIEIFWKKGGTDKFSRDDLIRYWKSDTTFEIQAKSGDITVNISETIKIVVKKKEKK